MKKNAFFEKYCMFSCDDGKYQCIFYKNRMFFKVIDIPETETSSEKRALKFINSRVGESWDTAKIFNGRRLVMSLKNDVPKDSKNGTTKKQAEKENYKKEWTLIVESPRGGRYPGVKVVLKKSPREMSPAEIRGLVEKHIHGPWMRGGFVDRGFWTRHFYNKNEKQIPIVGAHAITGIPV